MSSHTREHHSSDTRSATSTSISTAGCTAREIIPKLLTTRQALQAKGGSAQVAPAASLALNMHVRCAFVQNGQLLTYSSCDLLAGGVANLWNIVAAEVLAAATADDEQPFEVRPLHYLAGTALPGLQVRSSNGMSSEWLTHPRLFHRMNTYLAQVLHDEPRWFAPQQGVVFTVGAGQLNQEVLDFAAHLAHSAGPAAITGMPMKYLSGFPAQLCPAGGNVVQQLRGRQTTSGPQVLRRRHPQHVDGRR
ncbi:hypothetical protein ACFPVT_02690 [Corynebacterium choanae]|uniref:Uncharacterized protein n=1 Tax=Corynebacterium choanae TaxID=1862358 RepID=A0A3G6J4U8_9CORY|nr:hypothetical protein [Corynebacterium choanae]AZA12986.1 hypothetical protein CCHOA_02850 [Corynebacterium choanae]